MPSRMRPPEDVRITLPTDDDWIVVKKHLTAGEFKASQGRMVKLMRAGEAPELDFEQVGISLIAEYLLHWSILDVAGQPVIIQGRSPEVKIAALRALDQEKYEEISDAVLRHQAAMAELREAEKKSPAGVTTSSPTSVSVS